MVAEEVCAGNLEGDEEEDDVYSQWLRATELGYLVLSVDLPQKLLNFIPLDVPL